MTDLRNGGVQWRATSVLIRTDIFARAQEEGIDISSECNRALADRLGIDYSPQKIRVENSVQPVIIAKEPQGRESPAEHEKRLPVRPILNAEDPSTPGHLKKMERSPLTKRIPPAPVTRSESATSEESPQRSGTKIPGMVKSTAVKKGKAPVQKKGKDDPVYQFLFNKIIRLESAEGAADRIAKDEMHQIFLRWCRTKKGVMAIDKRAFSIALKNRFVLEDVVIDGTQYWKNVRLR